MTTIKRLFVTYPSLRKFWKEVEESPWVTVLWIPSVMLTMYAVIVFVVKVKENYGSLLVW